MAIIREEFPTRRFWKSTPFIKARSTLFPNFQYHRIPKQGLPNWYPSRQAVPGGHWPPNKGCTDPDILKQKGSHHRNRRSRVYRILQLFVVSVILWRTGQEQTSRTTKDFSVHMPGTFLSPCPMPLPAAASWTHHPHLSQNCQLDRLSTRAATYVPWMWTRNGMAQHLSPLIENAKQGAREGALWLRVPATFSEDQCSVPGVYTGSFTTTCNSSLKGSNTRFWPLQAVLCMHVAFTHR